MMSYTNPVKIVLSLVCIAIGVFSSSKKNFIPSKDCPIRRNAVDDKHSLAKCSQKSIFWKSNYKIALAQIAKVRVWKTNPLQSVLFSSGMTIDADGSPRAYHPKDIGLDTLEHAGKNGNWWAIALQDGKPVTQKTGYYVSTTSLQDSNYRTSDQRRYINSEKIPYIVLPPMVAQKGRISLGDIALVYNQNNTRSAYAIYADTGADTRIGEGSIALAKALGVNADVRTGGVVQGIVYLVFPRSGNGKPQTLAKIHQIGKRLAKKWGGVSRIKLYLKSKKGVVPL
ncbi:MAG: glycoside hydrolase family 75 protein [Spirochaetota bacterium]